MKILIADDDPQIIRALRITLGASGYDVIAAKDGAEALRKAISEHPDIIMLDLGMPELDGVEVIHGLRGWSQVPVLVVSGRTGAADKVEALDAGADDYVTKPFIMDELLARIRALTRRTPTTTDQPIIAIGKILIDFSAKTVLRDGVDRVRLTPTEWRLLELLTQSPGQLLTRESLLTQIWGSAHSRDAGYLRLYIAQLRKKLEPEPSQPRYLVTVQGMGYRYSPE
ncbi:MAG: response regulator transcription factor [Candidatus Saccharibacteria bacterium]|nr:response regulator transcription factor [Microbacteriaceae bacterium]